MRFRIWVLRDAIENPTLAAKAPQRPKDFNLNARETVDGKLPVDLGALRAGRGDRRQERTNHEWETSTDRGSGAGCID
jgi:hypothetical protein